MAATVDRLGDEIRRQHDMARPDAQLRLRVALDFGHVLSDEYGVLGDAVIQTFRLLDAPLFKRRVQQSGARLSVILSDRLYADVVRPDLGHSDPSEYERLRIRSKETRTRAWIRLLGVPPVRAPRPGIAFEDVSAVAARLLGATPLDTAEGRDALVAALPYGLRGLIQRQPDAMMDAYCILRPCVDDSSGRSALLRALGGLSLPASAFDDLQEAISTVMTSPQRHARRDGVCRHCRRRPFTAHVAPSARPAPASIAVTEQGAAVLAVRRPRGVCGQWSGMSGGRIRHARATP